MRRRVRLIRGPGDKDGDGAVPRSPQEDFDAGSEGFSLHFSGGQGLLRVGDTQLGPVVRMDLLEMAIPKIAFPFDVSKGIRGLRNKRHKLIRLKLSVSLDGLLAHVRSRLSANSWIGNVRIALEDDGLNALLEYGPLESRVPVSFRLLPSTGDRRCALLLDDVWVYGPVPVSLLTTAATILRELVGVNLDGVEFIPPDPVKYTLMGILPSRGWRIPSHDDITLTEFKMLPDRVELEFGIPDGATQASEDSSVGMKRLRRLEELRLTRSGDRLLAKGEMGDARIVYSRLLDREPDNVVAAVRLAMLDVVDSDMRDTARALVSDVAGAESDRPDVRAVMAHGAALAGDVSAEIEALENLFQNGSPLERLAAGLRIGKLTLESDPERAIFYFEGALAAKREEPEALLALIEACAVAGLKGKVEKLVPRWIAVHRIPAERARAHLKIGRVLLEILGDGAAAVKHFERAAMAEPTNPEAAWGLADALADTGEVPRAVAQYERLERMCKEAGDEVGVARAIQSIGHVWSAAGELKLAIPRFREALVFEGDNPRLRLLLADALIGLEQYAEAAAELESILGKTSPDQADFPWGETAIKLAGLYMEVLDDPPAAEPWIRAAEKCEETRSIARKRLVEMFERQGKWSELTTALERTVVAEPTIENVVSLARARLKAGEFASAVSTLEGVLIEYPEDGVLLDLFVEACRGSEDFVKLKDALVRRFERTIEPGQRASLAAELGDIELKTFENPGEAITWYENALKENRDLLEARKGLAEALKRLQQFDLLDEQLEILAVALSRKNQRPEAAQILVERARLKIDSGQDNAAAGLLRRALPDLDTETRREALIKIAEVSLSSGDYRSARDMFSAARKEPGLDGNHEAALGEAEASLKLKDYAAAFEAATAAGSGPSELRLRAAISAAQAAIPLGRAEEAVGILLRVGQNAEPEEGAGLLILAADIVNKHLKKPERSEQILEQLLEEMPDCAEAKKAFVNLLEQKGNRVELARGLVRFVDDDAEDVAVLKQAADFFSAEELYEEAADALKRAYVATKDTETARMYAQILRRTGEFDQMLSVLEEFAPRDEAAREMMVVQLMELGRHEEAASLIEAYRHKSSDKERERLLRLAQIQSGSLNDYGKATRSLIDALDLDDEDGHARQIALDAVAFAEKSGDPSLLAEAIRWMVGVAAADEKASWMFVLGGVLWNEGNLQDAENIIARALSNGGWKLSELADATRRYPRCQPLLNATAEKAAADGEWRLANEMLSMSIGEATGTEKAKLLRKRAAVRRMRLGDVDGAIEDLLEARTQGVLPGVEIEELVALLEKKGDTSVAAEVADGLASESGDIAKLAHAARLNDKAGNQPVAVRLWRRAIALSPEPSSIIALVKLLDPAKDGEEIDSLLKMLHGREDLLDIPDHMILLETTVALDLARGQELDAVEGLAAMMNLDPGLGDPWKKMVNILERRGEWSALAKRMDERLTLAAAPDDVARTAMGLGLLLEEKMGDEDGAVAAFERVISVSPEHKGANLALARIAYGRQQWSRLDKHVLAMGKMEWNPEITLWRARAAEHQDRQSEALEAYRMLIIKDSALSQAVEGLVRLSESTDHDEEVISAAERLIEAVGPENVKTAVHRRLGLALMRKGRLDDALERLEFADKLSGGDPESLRILAALHDRAHRHRERAEVLCKLAFLVEDDDKASCFVDAAALYLDRLEDPKRAGQLFRSAAETSRDHPDVLLGLADCAWLEGNLPVVAKNLERHRLVAPERPLKPQRMYRFAAALAHTREWPREDIIEMLEQVAGRLDANDRDGAARLIEELKKG